MDEELLKIYSLMKAAEDQLAALKRAIAALSAERAAFAEDRAALQTALADQTGHLKAATAHLKTVGSGIHQTARDATPALQDAARKAVEAAMAKTLTQVATHTAKALETALGPILERFASVVQAARGAEATLKRAGQWFAWKWAVLAAAATAGTLLVAYAVLTVLDSAHDAALTRQHRSLTQDIAQLRETADALEKRTYGLYTVTGNDGVFLILPKGAQITQCRAGPCVRLLDATR